MAKKNKEQEPIGGFDAWKVFLSEIAGYPVDGYVLYMKGEDRESIQTVNISTTQLLGIAERIRLHGATQVVNTMNKYKKKGKK